MSRSKWCDPELSDLLAHAKRIDDAPAAAKMRVTARIHDFVTADGGALRETQSAASLHPGAAAAGTLGGAGVAAKASGLAFFGVKGLTALAFVVAVSGGASVIAHSYVAPALTVVGSPQVADAPRAANRQPVFAPPTGRIEVPRAEPESASESPLSALPPVPPSAEARGAPARVPPAKTDPRPELAAERALLDPARAALGRGDAAAALAATRTHEQRFGSGALTEESEAIAIRALVLAGRASEAGARAARFAAHHPHSLLLPAIQASLPPGNATHE